MAHPAGQVWRRTRAGLVLRVRLTPRAGHDEVSGVERHGPEWVLKARVRALPDKGQANTALERLIAKWLGVPASCVALASGGKSRLKSVAVQGDADALADRLENRLKELA